MCSKRKRTDEDADQYSSVIKYASLKAWILKNYEHVKGSFVSCGAISCHVMDEKENILIQGNEMLPTSFITRAVVELYGDGGVRKCRKMLDGQWTWVFDGLQCRKEWGGMNNGNHSWDELVCNITTTASNIQNWHILQSDTCVSCVQVEDERYDNQRAITEIRFENNEKSVNVYINYHQRSVPESVIKAILHHFKQFCYSMQAFALMMFLSKSYVCLGLSYDSCPDTDLQSPRLCKHSVLRDGVQEDRLFSKDCQVLTNSRGIICTDCMETKTVFRRKMQRQMERKHDSNQKFTNHRYMSKEEIICKLAKEKNDHQQLKRKCERMKGELIDLEEDDHNDLVKIIESTKKQDIPENMMTFWEQQKQILSTDNPKRYRWHPAIMKICIELYVKNPHVLDPLRSMIYLPSNRTIRHHKNKVQQQPGWSPEILKWCATEAKEKELKEADYWGGLILDEMKIQEDIEMVVKNGKHRIVGFVDLGKIHSDMEIMSRKQGDIPKLATHVLQFIFLGDSGFRFPIAQFPSNSCTQDSLYFLFWEGVRNMFEYGFTIYFCILDGAELNRQFIKLHFSTDAEIIDKHFVTPSPYTGIPVVFLMDPKHNFKKIRNNILKSSIDGKNSTRCLKFRGKHIIWEHFVNAFQYDQGEFSMSLHKRLTADHFELNPSSKMRNHLAEDVLDKDMLYLMKAYQEHLKNKPGQDPTTLDGTIELLEHSSKAIELFHHKVPISSVTDSRLTDLGNMLTYLEEWKSSTPPNDSKSFISPKLYFDLRSMIHGLKAVVSIKLQRFTQSTIKPAIVNQDVVENHFAQVRACNGQNNNPSWKLQEATQNTIRLGQTTISRKSNAGLNGLKKSKV